MIALVGMERNISKDGYLYERGGGREREQMKAEVGTGDVPTVQTSLCTTRNMRQNGTSPYPWAFVYISTAPSHPSLHWHLECTWQHPKNCNGNGPRESLCWAFSLTASCLPCESLFSATASQP